MRVHICGARGSIPAPGPDHVRYGGHTSCVAIAHDGRSPSLILDAGTGITRVPYLLESETFQGTILLGHLHWDHLYGLPFFSAGDHSDSRIRLCIPDQGDALDVLTGTMRPPFFPITPQGLKGDWTFEGIRPGRHEHEGFSVIAQDIPHQGGRTLGFRVSDGTSTLAYLSDHDAAPSGQTSMEGPALELARGADLLIHDAQYTDEERASWTAYGHSTVEFAVALAEAAEVKTLLLFHHASWRTDDQLDSLGRLARSRLVEVVVAAEGAQIDLPGLIFAGQPDLPAGDGSAVTGRIP